MSGSTTAPALLAAVTAQARRLAAWMERIWLDGQASPDQGPAIGPGEVARLLAPGAARAAEAAFHAGPAASLSADAAAAARALAADPGWRLILRSFELDAEEADLLALTLAVELDPGLARVVAYLHDDGRLTQPTAWLAARLAGRQPAPFLGTNLRRWLLAAPAEGASQDRLTTPWQADPAVAAAVAGSAWADPALAGAITRTAAADIAAWPVLHAGALETLAGHPDPRGAELAGSPGIGRHTLAAQFAAKHGQALLSVDLGLLVAAGVAPLQAITRTLRQAAMTGALAYFRAADAAREADWTRARALGVPFLRGVRHPTGEVPPVALAPLPIQARLELWRHLSQAPAPQGLITQRLTPAEITDAARTGRIARQRGRRPDHALLAGLPTPYDWDDLVLPDDIAAQLRAFEAQVRLRWMVYEDWGFSRLTHLGQGISALFGGPSGTGKTMAAQVLARSLGLDLLRVDLAGVVNKYIGETEKRLREVFDACEDSGALLFFDEADALFGQRTQVKDAHDRFANIEVDYLLQRIERFDGVAILATNRRQDVDPAFIRRLRFVIEFLPPQPGERLALWQRALPEQSPAGETIRGDLDFGLLSQRLPMTGAEIKGTALGAAFLARGEGTRIGMRHILTAAQREMAKQGQRLRVPLREAGG